MILYFFFLLKGEQVIKKITSVLSYPKMFWQVPLSVKCQMQYTVYISFHCTILSYCKITRGGREHYFTERQIIWTGPVQEKITWPGSGACWAETVWGGSRKEIFGSVQNNWARPGTGIKQFWYNFQFILISFLHT